jgi:hypothetical protein
LEWFYVNYNISTKSEILTFTATLQSPFQETKYYTEVVTEDAKKEDDRESRAQITSRAGLLINELPSNI